jgi:uncharacterized protein (DUF1501 family)
MHDEDTDPSRRRFLKMAASLGAYGAMVPLGANLLAMSEASAAGATDYKALVCIFLYGGNDYANTLVPYDTASHGVYAKIRGKLAFTRDQLTPNALNSLNKAVDVKKKAHQYALAPGLEPLLQRFNDGRLGVLLNVGTLIQPTSRQQYDKKTVRLPARLFSHNDQQSVWQASAAEGAIFGWAGLMQDTQAANNLTPLFSSVNAFGNAVFLAGQSTPAFQIGSSGPQAFNLVNSLGGSAAAGATLRRLMTGSSPDSLLRKDYAALTAQALDGNIQLRSALTAAPTLATPFNSDRLSAQLKAVSQVIAASQALGMKRQVFFVGLGGFDNHDALLTTHPQLLAQLASAMTSFDDAMEELGLDRSVTAFTASDFGRTLTVNNDGSDHGWGSMHFVLGGAVKGQTLYGTPPVVGINDVDDVGQGRLLPTTSVDQYAATLGKWYGLSDAQLLAALPNLVNFPAKSRNLGFLKTS